MEEPKLKEQGAIWHVVDVRAIWIKEFASALGREVPTLGWLPSIRNQGLFERWEREEVLADPPLTVRHFPLQRGFARPPIAWLAREGTRISRRLARRSPHLEASPLVCTAPHYAALAESWRGPVIYYVTDLFPAYGEDPQRIRALDERMCRASVLVCPNSRRIAEYLRADADCPEEKLAIIPNATRASNLLPEPALNAAELPKDISDLQRPVAGVLGNLANNTDWLLLRDVIERTPWLSWAFVGPTEMPVLEHEQREARNALMSRGDRVRFTGTKPYGALRDYARSFDVAVLPYRKIEPTYSGSSTRFYEHLATCRPMLSTGGVEELLHKEPLLRLTNSVAEMLAALEELKATNFRDGVEEARWQASYNGTWEARASSMLEALTERLPHLTKFLKEVA